MNHNSKLFIYFILGNLIILMGLMIGQLLPPLIEQIINKQIAIIPASQSYPMWKESPVPIYQKFYFFNVTNPQDIELGDKPKLEEIGPFTYRSEWRNEDIDVGEDQGKVDFRHIKQWYFEPGLSIADHRLQIVTINAPLAITMSLIQSAPNAVRYVVTFSLDGFSEGFFTKRSIKQLLFDGYPDLLTTVGPFLNSEMLSQGGQFAYFNGKNNSEDGHYEIDTGALDINKLNTIIKFNGRSKLPYWSQKEGSQCSSLDGATTGEMFPPITEDQTEIKLFQPDFCRVWKLNYVSKYEHPSGLKLKRFKASRDIFRNSSDFPENSCYFSTSQNIRLSSGNNHQASVLRNQNTNQQHHHHDNRIPNHASDQQPLQLQQQNRPSIFSRQGRHSISNQNSNNFNGDTSSTSQAQHNSNRHHQNKVRQEWPNGVFTLAPCKFNAPIYLSLPHFLDADSSFGNEIEGLQPNPEKHDFFMDIEPRTGAPVVASARVQINLAISRPPGLIRLRNIPEIMFPVFWQQLEVNLTGPILDNLLLASRQAQENTHRVSMSFLFMGAAILVTTLLFFISSNISKTKSDDYEVDKEDEIETHKK